MKDFQAILKLHSTGQQPKSLKSRARTLLWLQVSLNDFVVRAVALALAEVPSANSMWDSKSEEVRRFESVDVAIAVATDKGLITPILKNANTKSLSQVMCCTSETPDW